MISFWKNITQKTMTIVTKKLNDNLEDEDNYLEEDELSPEPTSNLLENLIRKSSG